MLAASALAFTQAEIGVPNMYKREDITPEILRQLLRHEPDTGKLFWLPRDRMWFKTDRSCSTWNSRYGGKEAFTTVDMGYKQGSVLDLKIRAHTVAWAIHYGVMPSHSIDHINGDRSDNRIKNLRDVPHSVNGKNQALRRNNTSGALGVSWWSHRGVWAAAIMVNSRRVHLGYFADKEDAIRVRKDAEKRFGFHENHGRHQP
jgi:hypothetical protein